MSEVRDLDGDAQDRDGMNVAQEPRERIEVSRLMDPSPPLIPGPAGQEMDMETERRSPGPSEESPRRGEETGGGDSSLTNLRGKSRLIPLLFPHDMTLISTDINRRSWLSVFRRQLSPIIH